MTQTVSFKQKLRQCLTTFKWELRNCSGALLINTILASVAVIMTFTICLVFGFSAATDSWKNSTSLDYDSVLTSIRFFQLFATYMVFALNVVFTIIYTIRVYSYLHNKRKADMYCALPISRRTFFVAKTISAYILSTVPTMFFFSVIALISVCFGQPLVNEVSSVYLNLFVGAIACISFYGLLAVCCGTTINSVLAFVAINFAYVGAAWFIKGTIMSFLQGLPLMIYENSFIMKALNPLSAYGGGNIIYWLLFTAACLALGIFLVKKRRAECAQTSFAYWLPAYMVKVLVAFDAGMFLGSIFGAIGVFFVPFAGFMFGFVLGSVPAYVITHMILCRGVGKLFKTAIPLGGLVVAVAGVMFFLSFDLLGFNGYVPEPVDIKSAGVVSLNDCYFKNKYNAMQLGGMASDDYTDSKDIGSITTFHHGVVTSLNGADYNPYSNIWINMFTGSLTSLYNDGYVISYKLNNGFTVTRCYYESYSSEFKTDKIDGLLKSKDYFIRYSSLINANPDEVYSVNLGLVDEGDSWSSYYYRDYVNISADNTNPTEKADMQRLLEAYRKDFAEHGDTSSKDKLFRLQINYVSSSSGSKSSFMGELISMIPSMSSNGDSGFISEDFTETLKVMREMGVIDKNNQFIKTSEYYIK